MDKFICKKTFAKFSYVKGFPIFECDEIYDGEPEYSGFNLFPKVETGFRCFYFSSDESSWNFDEHFISLAEYRNKQIDEILR